MITFSKISASYDGKNQAVSGVSFCVDKPAIVGIIGPNGAGKSTFIKAALQLIPSEGHVTSNGMALNKFQKDSLRGTKDCSRLYISDYSKRSGVIRTLSAAFSVSTNNGQRLAESRRCIGVCPNG